MSDTFDPTSILRDRYEALAARRVELRDELDPLELEMARLQAGLKAMGALDIPAVLVAKVDPPAALRLVGQVQEMVDPYEAAEMRERRWMAQFDGADPSDPSLIAHRVRHPDLQKAIDEQTPSVAIPRGTKLYCGQGCVNGEAVGFGDQFALRTHCKRTHDREPTEAEKVPR